MYLDANFFIFCNFDSTQRGENARRIQQKIALGNKAATSAITLDEVMWVIIKTGKREVLRETIEDIYAIPNLAVQEATASTPLDAIGLIEQFDLKPRDAFHVAIMRSIGISEIVSDDSDFDRVKGLKRIRL